MSFIAGGYTATYNALACGQAGDGYRLSHEVFKRLITGDSYAESPQDGVYRGMAMFVSYTMIEFNAAAAALAKNPYSATIHDMGLVGRLDVASSLAKSLVLTAVAGTPAAATPASATFSKSILAEGFPVEILFAPNLRDIPIRMRVYPVSGVFGTET